MIWTITKKEFLTNLLTLRFFVGLTLCLLLAVLSTHVQITAYQEELLNYNNAIQKHKEDLAQVKVYSKLEVGIDRPPEVLSILCEGFDRKLPNTAKVRFNEESEIGLRFGRNNPLLKTFKSIDLVLVIQLVLSVLALFITYDAIAGEKQRGTLRQMLANTVARHQILLGKYIGSILTLTVPLLVTFIIALLMMIFSPAISLTPGEWFRIGSLVISSLIYVSLFGLMGIAISSLNRTASTSLMLSLFLWITFVVIVPNSAAYATRYLKPAPSSKAVEANKQVLEMEQNEQGWQFWSTKIYPFVHDSKIVLTWHNDRIMLMYLGAVHRDVVQLIVNNLKEAVAWQIGLANRISNLYQNYYNALRNQAQLSNSISRLSPGFSYWMSCSSLAGTDLNQAMQFLNRIRSYRETLTRYMHDQKAFSSSLFFTRKIIDETPQITSWDELKVFQSDNQPPLELPDLPEFKLAQPNLVDIFAQGIIDWGLLVFWNILLFTIAFVSFLRYDAR
jgi:ABC-type transport system involved in multi-copper enzyme maturation permease subunit